ncbi:MAG: ATP-grasp domain-containing protein [Alphaproteobacteria bacterium]|nr:ATP-grasp domain-containing protein [Alphaproteobacteria bacterium]
MNVLITSAAAKVLLVQAFQHAAAPHGGKAFTADVAETCAAGLFSDRHFPVKRIDAPGALEELFDICAANAVRLIVPTRDGELPFFARHKAAFAARGVTVLVPDEACLAVCQDKRRFGEAISAVGLAAIPVVDPVAAAFPLFVRPATGAGGRGAMCVENAAALATLGALDDLLVHPFITAPEYSIDLLMDFDGRALQAVVRERTQVVAGESKITTVVDHPVLAALTLKLGEALGLVGHNTVQAFDDPQRGPLFIEVNPRFGGASNCSIEAGLQSPARIFALLAGDETARAPRPIRHGLTMYRYAQDVFA